MGKSQCDPCPQGILDKAVDGKYQEQMVSMDSVHGSNMEIWSTHVWGVHSTCTWISWERQMPKKYVYEYGLEFLTIQSEGVFVFCVCILFFSNTDKANIVPTLKRTYSTLVQRSGKKTKNKITL